MNENIENVETPENNTPTHRKVLIMAGTVVGIIIAGGFAFLKNQAADEERSEEIVIEIDPLTPETIQL